jgi:hypothetical protein
MKSKAHNGEPHAAGGNVEGHPDSRAGGRP